MKKSHIKLHLALIADLSTNDQLAYIRSRSDTEREVLEDYLKLMPEPEGVKNAIN